MRKSNHLYKSDLRPACGVGTKQCSFGWTNQSGMLVTTIASITLQNALILENALELFTFDHLFERTTTKRCSACCCGSLGSKAGCTCTRRLSQYSRRGRDLPSLFSAFLWHTRATERCREEMSSSRDLPRILPSTRTPTSQSANQGGAEASGASSDDHFLLAVLSREKASS